MLVHWSHLSLSVNLISFRERYLLWRRHSVYILLVSRNADELADFFKILQCIISCDAKIVGCIYYRLSVTILRYSSKWNDEQQWASVINWHAGFCFWMIQSETSCRWPFDGVVSGALVAVLVGVAIGMLIGSLLLFAIVLIKNRYDMLDRWKSCCRAAAVKDMDTARGSL